jgi:hypothetical protein
MQLHVIECQIEGLFIGFNAFWNVLTANKLTVSSSALTKGIAQLCSVLIGQKLIFKARKKERLAITFGLAATRDRTECS